MLHFIVGLLFFLLSIPVMAGECKKTGERCVDNSCKMIGGEKICRCWQFEDSYDCWEDTGKNDCQAFIDNRCSQFSSTCLKKDNNDICAEYDAVYDCEKPVVPLPANTVELPSKHIIHESWESENCDAASAQFAECKITAEICLEGASTKIINGVEVHQDCWRKQVEKICHGQQDNTECQALIDKKCTLKKTVCLHKLPTGLCDLSESTYICEEKPGQEIETNTCEDHDFSKVLTGLEMAREMQRYVDPESGTFFKGDASTCSVKLGGALDGVFGGNCCKAKGDPGKFVDSAVVGLAKSYVEGQFKKLGSEYTYTMLTNAATKWLSTTMSTVGSQAASVGLDNVFDLSNFSFYGVGLSMQGGSLVLTFNPASFAIAVAIQMLQQYLKCDTQEQLTTLRRTAGLCSYVGSYCSKDSALGCIEKIESYCCFISKLARIVNTQGREQLGKDWGSPENPQCEGFTAQELEKLDFSKMDLSEFYDEIIKTLPDEAGIQTRAKKQLEKQTEESGRNYYD